MNTQTSWLPTLFAGLLFTTVNGNEAKAQSTEPLSLSIASVDGRFAPLTGVPIRVKGMLNPSVYDLLTNHNGQTGAVPVTSGDLLNISLGEASQMEGIAVGMLRTLVLGLDGAAPHGTQVLSQPLALPVHLQAYLLTPRTIYSTQYPFWAVSLPPGQLSLRTFIAPLFHEGEVADALAYHGVISDKPYIRGLAFRVPSPSSLGPQGIELDIHLEQPIPGENLVVDVFNIRQQPGIVPLNPACASAAFLQEDYLHFTLAGNLQPGWCLLAVRPDDGTTPTCTAPPSKSPGIAPQVPLTYQDPTAICSDCVPEEPIHAQAVCQPQDPQHPKLCEGWAWTSNEPGLFEGGLVLAGCDHRRWKIGKTLCAGPAGGSLGFAEQFSLKVTVSASVKASAPGVEMAASLGHEIGVAYTGGMTVNAGAGQYQCGECVSLWYHLNLCYRTWTGHDGSNCTKDVNGLESCLVGDSYTVTYCSRRVVGHTPP